MPSASPLTVDGHCSLPDVFSADDTAALRAEAAALAADAGSMSRDGYRVNDDESIASPRRMRAIAAGPALRAIQREDALLDLLERLAGHRVAPTSAVYIFYAPGDYFGLHRDHATCEVTLLTCVAGAVDPLILHPELAGLPAAELLEISREHAAIPPGGAGVAVPDAGAALMLLGSKVPHHRAPATRAGSVATMCFA